MQGKTHILTVLLGTVLISNVLASDDSYYAQFLEVSKAQKGFISDASLVDTNNLGPNLTNAPISFSKFTGNGELAGVRLGMDMSQVIAAWGKPPRLFTLCGLGPRFWYVPAKYYGAVTLAFKTNRLAIIVVDVAQMKGVAFDNGLNAMSSDLDCEKTLGAPTLRYPHTGDWFFGGEVAYCANAFRTGLNFDSIAASNPAHNKSVLSQISVASGDAQVPVRNVTFTSLLNDPERYQYLRLKLECYSKSRGNLLAIYESKEQSTLPRQDNVWIAPTARAGHENDVQPIKEGKVRVIGMVDFGLRSLELGVGRSNHWDIEISDLELLEEIKD